MDLLRKVQPDPCNESLSTRFREVEEAYGSSVRGSLPSPRSATAPPTLPSIEQRIIKNRRCGLLSNGDASRSTIEVHPVAQGTSHSRRGEVFLDFKECNGAKNCECFSACERLQSEMMKYVRVYECSFEDLQDMDDSLPLYEGEVQLLLTDPPFNHRGENGTAKRRA